MDSVTSVSAGSFDRIIALDLGKFKSVVCLMDVATHKHTFVTLATTSPKSLHDFLSVHTGAGASRTLVVFETCDAAGWVHDLAVTLGFAVKVVNPSGDAWRWKKVKRKTDKDDALKLARMALMDQLPTVHMPAAPQRQWRRLIQHRRSLVRRRTQCKNQIRSIHSQQGLALPRGGKVWTIAGIAQLKADAKALGDCTIDDLWRGRLEVELQLLDAVSGQIAAVDAKLDALGEANERVKLLQSVRGVGPRLAEAVVVHLDDVTRFKDAAHVGSYVGLVPKQLQSGEMNRIGRITRRGPSLLRGLLVEVAWMVYRYNAWARSFVDRVSRGMKNRKKIAIVALARKLLVMLWAMLRDNTPWREPAEPETSAQETSAASAAVAAPA